MTKVKDLHTRENYPLHHIGIAVEDLNTSIEQYKRMFGFRVGLREKLEDRHIELAFLELPNTLIELLAPVGQEGVIAKFLKKRGPGLHHLCYKVAEIHTELARLKGQGFKLIDEVPRPGAGNSLIAFLHPDPKATDGVLIELWQELSGAKSGP